jgi:platelet-activating factor acetylhydrolase
MLNIFPSLPKYPGQHNVGWADYESDNKLMVRVYYPSTIPQTTASSWLPNASLYSYGYGNFLQIGSIISTMLIPLLAFIRIPCTPHPPLLESKSSLPLVIFSHGLAGMRTTYSNICGSLASQGCVVVAIEHSDGTACATERNKQVIHYRRPVASEMKENETQEEYGMRFRKAQIETRVNEVTHALEFVDNLTKGNVISSENNKIDDGKFDWKQFNGKLNSEKVALIGHSFGAATVLASLQTPLKVTCAVLMDPWMFAVPNLNPPSVPHLHVRSMVFSSFKPRVSIGRQTWMI